MNKGRILFVDDESRVLDGLRRMLRPFRKEWFMTFVQSGQAALEELEKQSYDVLITDIRMPGMNGAELLAHVKERHPSVARIVLSGHSDLESVVESVLPAHQYLSKPCDPNKLKAVITQALNANKLVENETLKNIIASLDALPVLPQLYEDINAELSSEDPSLQAVSEIISQDVAMSAEILKLVNSSFFGFARHIGSVDQAVTMLGVNIIKSLVLTVHIFSVFDAKRSHLFSINRLWEHCIRVSSLSRRICRDESCSREMSDDACIAGMLHDIGKLVLITTSTDEYNEVLRIAHAESRWDWLVEMDVLGTTHAEVGAYLMGLWGMPDHVVEAIAFHHMPQVRSKDYRPLTAVYAANLLDHKFHHKTEPEFDMDYLTLVGVAEHLPRWERATQEYLEELDDGEQ